MGVYRKVRALYRDHIAPIVEQYIGTILWPLLGLMHKHDMHLYVRQVSTFLTYLPTHLPTHPPTNLSTHLLTSCAACR